MMMVKMKKTLRKDLDGVLSNLHDNCQFLFERISVAIIT